MQTESMVRETHIELLHLHLENFKGFKDADFDFFHRTKVSGANGLGKSTLAAAYMWLFWNIDYNLGSNPNVRRKIDRQPVNDAPVSVEATLDIDGTEVTAKKVQKRSFKKDGSFSDDNTYFINDAPKTLRDFNEYFGFDMKDFKLSSNINAFLAQKAKEMRDFLFRHEDDALDIDVARQFDELSELAKFLEKYTVEELTAMNKASIAKITKEQNNIPAAIAENKRYLVDDIDTAELELQKNAIQEKIDSLQEQLEDSDQARSEWKKKSDYIMDLQFKKTDMERIAMERLLEERKELQKQVDKCEEKFNESVRKHGETERKIAFLEQEEQRKSDRKNELLEQWRAEKKKTFPRENDEFVDISYNDLLCPTCGQPLPEDLKAKKIAKNDEERDAFYRKKEEDRERFLRGKKETMDSINARGKKLVEEISEITKEISSLKADIERYKNEKITYNGEKTDAMRRLNSLPTHPDMSGNQEYENICMEIKKKEEELKAGDTGSNYRMVLKGKLEEAKGELDEVKRKILSASKNAEYEQRIADLEEGRIVLEQKKANCERILDMLDKLDEKKNEILVDGINSHFMYVRWDLFSRAKNGSYKKDYCKPVIDGKDYGDDTNTGLEILAKLDIAMAAQRATGIYCPIFLDYGESIDSWRIPECESQLIVLCRTDDMNLRIEEVA